jgi:hypothetical protein
MGERPVDLKQLRAWRNWPERDVSIGGAVKDLAREAQKRVKAMGGIGVAWEVVTPDRVKEKCEVVSFSRGVLTVRVRDSSARFELDRWWRSGGEREICAAGKVGVKRLKVVG